MPRGRSPGYEVQRDAILAQAAHLFARSGYPATSMNQVAQACGLSKATLYHYFEDKYSLLVSLTDGQVSRLLLLVSPASRDSLTPAQAQQQLHALICSFVAEYVHAQDAHRVLTEDVKFLQPLDRERVLGKERDIVAAFARLVGGIRPDLDQALLAKPLTMLLFGMINWLFTWMKPGGSMSHDALAPMVADLFLGGLGALALPLGLDLQAGVLAQAGKHVKKRVTKPNLKGDSA